MWIFALIFVWISMHGGGRMGCRNGGACGGFPWWV